MKLGTRLARPLNYATHSSVRVFLYYFTKRWMQTTGPFVRKTKTGQSAKDCLQAGPILPFCASLQLTTQGALTLCAHTPGPVAHNQCTKQYSPPRHLSSATADAWSAPPRLRNTLRYQTGFDHGHGLTTEWKRVGSKRFMALDSLVPFACSK